MANVCQMVKDMASECERGQTPALLSQFLHERTAKRGRLSRLLSGPCTCEVHRVDPFEDAGFFRESSVFWVFADEHLLEGAVLPSGGSFGLFALGPSGLLYLNHRRDNVQRLLLEEGRPLDECDPIALASLVAEALGREGNSSHDVIKSLSHLIEYQGGFAKFAGGYEVNDRERERVGASVVPPTITGSSESGWQLEFCSVFGWMHDKRTLVHHRFLFALDFRIEQRKQVLSRRIFKRVPAVRY